MSASETRTAITLSVTDLENIIRRVVREELQHASETKWAADGAGLDAEDEQLLAEALVALEVDKRNPQARIKWDDFEKELDGAEAAGELPS